MQNRFHHQWKYLMILACSLGLGLAAIPGCGTPPDDGDDPPPEQPICSNDGDCDDGLFCNGTETCTGNACVAGTAPCDADLCDEPTDICAIPSGCFTNFDCSDDLFCNGSEVCGNDGTCLLGAQPCSNVESCDENSGACFADRDGDGVADDVDNCPDDRNADQADGDGDGTADACDNCPVNANPDQTDDDNNGIGDLCEGDQDGDGALDISDNCQRTPNTDQLNSDNDTLGNVCDNCSSVDNEDQLDTDNDGVGDACDNCPTTHNSNQDDSDLNGIGDVCDLSGDGGGPGGPPGGGGDDPVCGDGTPDIGEQCDDGGESSQCDADCTLVECGDAVTNASAGEQCDPPDGSRCSADCLTFLPNCGNGSVNPGEECDDGGQTDMCDADCTFPVCGDNVRNQDAGEDCDDGNTIPGDGCDSACRVEANAVANDSCANAIPILDGPNGEKAFSNLNATTDGAAEPSCNFPFDDPQVGSDVWFVYESTCQGEVVVSLCGSAYDTKLAVYDGAGCPSTAPTACNDDGCGVSFESRVTFTAQSAGQMFMIRVGGFQGDQGDGFINIRCDLDVCVAGGGDCFAVAGNGSRGCDDATCCGTTCEADPFCCDVDWDDFCAAEASGLCGTDGFDTCVAGAGSCASGHADGAAGCEDEDPQRDCCNTVCMIDPFCCLDTWDDICAQTALSACFLTCGGSSGGCFIPGGNGTPGCDDQACCEAVCVDDPFCCDTTWDSNCFDMATAICR